MASDSVGIAEPVSLPGAPMPAAARASYGEWILFLRAVSLAQCADVPGSLCADALNWGSTAVAALDALLL